jgi:hypothetical protein
LRLWSRTPYSITCLLWCWLFQAKGIWETSELESHSLTFSCLTALKQMIKEFSDLSPLNVGHKTLILEGSCSKSEAKKTCTIRLG